jgi:sugar lactone lactonase YvrE
LPFYPLNQQFFWSIGIHFLYLLNMTNLNLLFLVPLSLFLTSCSKNGTKPNQKSNNGNSNSPKIGIATTFAGNGIGGTAAGKGVASFSGAYGLVIDKSGNLYASDYSTTLIRKITPDGNVSTFAGNTFHVSNGTPASIDGAGTAASFTAPAGMTIDGSGNIYVADQLTIRKITPDGVVTTVGGSRYFNNSRFLDITLDTYGNIYASDINNEVILKINTNGTSEIFANGGIIGTDGFKEPLGMVFDGSGNLFLVDGDDAIHRISTDKTVSTIAGKAMVAGFSNGIGAQASFLNPVGIIRDPSGNLFVSDYGNKAIREIMSDGSVSTVVLTNGSNSPSGPYDMVFDSSGNMFLADGTSILKITLQ